MKTRLVIISAHWGPKPTERAIKLVKGRIDSDGKTRISTTAYQDLLKNVPRGVGVWFS